MSGMVETCCGMERGVYSFIERGQRLSEREATHMHLQGASNGGFGNQMYQKGEANCDHRNGWYKWHSNSVSRGGLTWSIWEQEEKCRSQTGTNTPG